ncbi:CBS domain containing membrane protein [Denitrovibrio acetiphilus DSM 12809]|uniref:CBS domain containing membrane protein n=1 Tax=Denitrovibrio acetiphilus (strain DSM 12809 / NBRC 114555 / N2460) TaxID=522772 RepID=D4H7L9_DENA2|nr:CBS domain-containing protein [Denitrovibrio acetiphilus]ADD68018.1 CBS domain containing membrane protein [Denitrovibrio acetiphilus DSM 12809]
MKVSEIMTTNLITADPEETIKDVILKMRKKNVSGLPVVDKNNKVLATFSETDVAKALPDILNEAQYIPLVDVRELTSEPIKRVMEIPAYSIKADTNVTEAARIVLEKFRHRLPVVDDAGHLIGLVTLGDILKALLNK